MFSYRSFKISEHYWSSWMNVMGKYNTFKCVVSLQNIYRPCSDYIILITFSQPNTISSSYLCPGKHRKNKLWTLSRMAHTSTPIVFFHELTRLQFYCCSGANKITYALSWISSKIQVFNHLFYSIIDMVRRLPENWYIFCCVLNEPKLHKSALKSVPTCHT